MWNIYDGILLSRKKQNNAICSNMDATGDYHTMPKPYTLLIKGQEDPVFFCFEPQRCIFLGSSRLSYHFTFLPLNGVALTPWRPPNMHG